MCAPSASATPTWLRRSSRAAFRRANFACPTWASPHWGCSACATGCASGISPAAGSRRARSARASPTWSSTACAALALLRPQQQVADRLAEGANDRRRVLTRQFDQDLFEDTVARCARRHAQEEAIQVRRYEHRQRVDAEKADQ